MTFYWWSHWFWITTFTNILLITIVHTYPSQEISLEHNRNQSNEDAKTGVTKLYQTSSTATLVWSTVAPNSTEEIKLNNTVLQSIPSGDIVKEIPKDTHTLPSGVLILEADSDIDDLEDQDVSGQTFLAISTNLEAERRDKGTNNESVEFKRSAESYNKTNEITTINITSKPKSENTQSDVEVASVAEIQSPETGVEFGKRKRLEISNYTNFSSVIGPNAQESVFAINSNSAGSNGQEIELTKTNGTTDMAGSVSAPAGLRVNNAQSALDWINAMAPTTSSSSSNSTSKSANNEESTVSDSVAQQSQRVPFTLENVNKEDELRRAESEHRSRKSKVLSADYKHINRFINLSSDSKNLLTRSASSAPEYDAEEGNISSEALAIQRTYFLDAGAISAICFSIFGVCCAVGTVGIVLYRRRYLNKPQALSEPDSSVYIDDSTMRVSDNSDEMYSLDNDSFLNSLEAMTIQNYWTDTVKHTKL